MSVSVWQVLTALSPILAPLLSLLLVVIGRIIWNHEQRIRDLERGSNRQSRTLYGDEKDAQQPGLSEDINNLSERVEALESTLDEIHEQISDLRE